MKAVFDIVLFLEFLFHGYCVYIYCSTVFKEKRTRIDPLLMFLCAAAIEFIVYKTLYSVITNMAATIVLNTLAAIISYNVKWLLCIFHSSILAVVMCISEIIIVPFENLILSDNYLETHSMTTELFGSTVTKLVFFIFCKLVSRLLERETKSAKSLWLFVVPVISLLCGFMIMSLNDYHDEDHFNTVLIIFAASIMIINIVVFIVHESYVRNMSEIERLKLSEQKYELDYEHYNLLQEYYNDSRVLVHDFRHHMKVISAMAENNDIDTLKKYVNSVKIQEKDFSGNYIAGSKIVDVILFQMSERCKRLGISFSFIGNDVGFDFINDSDICCILSNLFDNAIEAAEKSKDKRIESEFFYNKNRSMLFIEIRNSCDMPLKKLGGRLATSKKNKNKHGIGLYSVEKTVSKYGGFLSYDYNETGCIFKTVAVLNTTGGAVTC